MENKFIIRLAEDVHIGKEVYKNVFSSLIFEFEDNSFMPKIDSAGNLIFNNEYMSFDKYPDEKQKIFETANNLYHVLNKKHHIINREIVLDICDLYEKFRDLLERHYKIILEENSNDLAKPDIFCNIYYESDDKINNKLKSQKENFEFWRDIRKRWYYILSWFFIIPGSVFEIFRHVKLKRFSEINKTERENSRETGTVKSNNLKSEQIKLYELAINRQLAFLKSNEIHFKMLAEKIADLEVAEKFKNMSVNEILLSGDESIAVKFVPDDTKNMKRTSDGAVSQTYEIKQDKLILQDGKLIYNNHEIGNLVVENNKIILKSDLKNVMIKELNKNHSEPGTIEIYLENKLIGKLNPKKVVGENKNNVFEYGLKSMEHEILYLKQGLLFFDIEHMKKIVEKDLIRNGKLAKEDLKNDLVVLKALLKSLLANKFDADSMVNNWRKEFENPYECLPGSANVISAEIWQELFRGNTNIDYIRKVINYLGKIINLADESPDKITEKDLELINLLNVQAVNTAYDGYLMYAIAKELGALCIVKTDIVVTPENYANIMANARLGENLDFNIFSHEQQESALWLNILDYICYNRDRGGWNFEVNKNALGAFDNDWSVPARLFLSKDFKMPKDYLDKTVPFVTKGIKEKIMNLKPSDLEIKMKMFCGNKNLFSDRLDGILERLDELKNHIKKIKCYDKLNIATGKFLFEKSQGAGCLGQYNTKLNLIRENLMKQKNDGDNVL